MARTIRLAVITNEHTELARKALTAASIKATIRKGKGSCRCQMYVTPTAGNLDQAIEVLEQVGFSLDFTMFEKAYMNRIA